MIVSWKDSEGIQWYKFKAKDIDMLYPAMVEDKFDDIKDKEDVLYY